MSSEKPPARFFKPLDNGKGAKHIYYVQELFNELAYSGDSMRVVAMRDMLGWAVMNGKLDRQALLTRHSMSFLYEVFKEWDNRLSPELQAQYSDKESAFSALYGQLFDMVRY